MNRLNISRVQCDVIGLYAKSGWDMPSLPLG